LHSPDGKKRGGAEEASLGGPLVMQVMCKKNYQESVNENNEL
jgi:hypothetical protein